MTIYSARRLEDHEALHSFLLPSGHVCICMEFEWPVGPGDGRACVAAQRKLTATQDKLLQTLWTPTAFPHQHNTPSPWGTECESVCSCCGQLASTLIPKDAVSSLYDRLRAPADLATVCNTQSRCDELVDSMEEILATKKLTRCDGERRGRLQLASNQIFGRQFRNCLQELNSHVARAFRTITEKLVSALTLMCQMLRTNQLRRRWWIPTASTGCTCMLMPLMNKEDTGLGGVLYESRGVCIGCFSDMAKTCLTC